MDFYLSRNRDVEIAKHFLRMAMKNQWVATKITLDATASEATPSVDSGPDEFQGGGGGNDQRNRIDGDDPVQSKLGGRTTTVPPSGKLLSPLGSDHRKVKIGQSIVLPIPESTSDS